MDKDTHAGKLVGKIEIGESTYNIVKEDVYNGENTMETTTITPAYDGITSFIVYDSNVVEILGGESITEKSTIANDLDNVLVF